MGDGEATPAAPRWPRPPLALVLLALWTAVCAALAGAGLRHLLLTVPANENGCTMTFMRPNYYPVPMVNRSRLAFKYRLLQYSHGPLTEQERAHRADKVLVFVPGSMGSFGQVRSIGKEVIERLQNAGLGKSDVAVYALDFDEEPSGLSGIFLEQQSEFLADCLRRLQALHGEEARFALFAHSMGGIVARSVVAALDAQADAPLAEAVVGVLSLSTPHAGPVIGADLAMFRMYRALALHTDRRRYYLSLGGGYRDTLVRSELVQLEPARYPRSASALTRSVATVDLSVDHQAVLWCNELVVALADEVCSLLEVDAGKTGKTGKAGKAGKAKLGLFEQLRSKKVPRAGFSRKSLEQFGLELPVGLLVADTLVRKYSLCVFQYMFAAALTVLALGSGSSPRTVLGWLAVSMVAALGAIGTESHAPVPPLLAGVALAAAALLLLLAQVFCKLLRGVLPWLQLASLPIAMIYVSWFAPVPTATSDLLAVAFLVEMANLVLLVLTSLAASPAGLGDRIWGGGPFQLAAGLLYAAAIPAWLSPTLMAISLLKPQLSLEEVFPLATVTLPRGVEHACDPTMLPPALLNGTTPVITAAEEGAWLAEEAHSALSWLELGFLVLSAALALPVLAHLALSVYAPVPATEEKVLDSQYQRVVRKAKPGAKGGAARDDDEVHGSEGSPGVAGQDAAGLRHRGEGAIVQAVQDRRGALVFDDTEYEGDEATEVIVFANGEEVQVADLKHRDPRRDPLPDAVPLISEGPTSPGGSRVSCVLVKRIRSAGRPFPDSRFLRAALHIMALLAVALGSNYLFLLQFFAPCVAGLFLALRSSSLPVERYETSKENNKKKA